jgi:hypothetical protein
MTLLVVGNHQAVDPKLIPWERVDEVMMVHCVEGGTFELKHLLQVHCRVHMIPLHIVFAIPPVGDVSTELLMGFGLRMSKEVILYGQCCDTLHPRVDEESEVSDNRTELPGHEHPEGHG